MEWTIGTLLTGLGRPWSLTTDGALEADIAYAPPDDPGPATALRLHASADAWGSPAAGAAARLREGVGSPGSDVLAGSFAVLTGVDERSWSRDRHGHHVPPQHADGLLPRQAVVSVLAQALDDALARRLGAAPFAPWPDGKAFAAVMTHDVDYPEAIRWIEPLRVVRRAGTQPRAALGVLTGRLHHWHFASWLDEPRRQAIPSAFFFVARRGSVVRYMRGTPDPFYDVRAPRFRALLRELAARGSEIALQPSYNAWQDPATILREKAVLEEALGAEVVGSRHHYWHLDPAHPEETLLAHEQAGLLYDCSLAFERLIGWRRGLAWPFHPFVPRLRRPVDTVQIPTAWMDDQVFGHASFNDTETPDSRDAALEALVARAAEVRGVFVSDIHEYVFDGSLFPGWRSTHERMWRSIAGRADAWIGTPREVAHRWRVHEDRIRSASEGLA